MPDLLLPVHGTFGARREDRGENWWQIGSPFYEGMRQRLPRSVSLTENEEMFHWSGENSERARIKAALELLDRLKALESEGRGYHLIGHSHGGSVIWHTLRMATLGKIGLEHLRSWTTVGTPFLRHKTRRTSRFTNILRIFLGLVLIKPAWLTAVTLFDLLFRPHSAVGLGNAHNLPKTFTFYETPVLRLLELLRVPLERSESGIRIGTFDSSFEHTSFEFLVTTPLGWLVLCLALAVIFIYLNLSVFFLRPVIESWQLWAENRLERRTQSLYSSRWLGLWSPDDEAINGLRATLDLSMSFVSRMVPHDRVLFSDYATVTLQPYYWVLTPLFNSILRPFLDNAVRSLVVKSAQGNNRPGAEVVQVSTVPWITEGATPPGPLPDWLNHRLVQDANESTRKTIPKLRGILAGPSLASGLKSWRKASSGRELIHTSYFDHNEVLDLIAMHIVGSCDAALWPKAGISQHRLELAHWLAEAKRRVGSQQFELPIARYSSASGAEKILRFPIRPRRRTNSERAA